LKYTCSIIIINYKSLHHTTALLDQLAVLNNGYAEIIVIDNGSPDFDTAAFKARYPDVKCLAERSNLGFAAANNRAASEAQGTYLFFLNNDTVLEDFFLPQLAGLMAENPEIGVLCPVILSMPGDVRHAPVQYAGSTAVNKVTGRNQIITSRPESSRLVETANMHGAAALMPRKLFDSLGGFSEDYFLYYEELDLSERIRQRGYKVAVAPEYELYHHGSATIGHASPVQLYYLTRGRIIFMRHWGTPLFYLYLIPVIILKLLSYCVRLRFSDAWTYLRATRDGFRQKLSKSP